jgi:hypothetical protein
MCSLLAEHVIDWATLVDEPTYTFYNLGPHANLGIAQAAVPAVVACNRTPLPQPEQPIALIPYTFTDYVKPLMEFGYTVVTDKFDFNFTPFIKGTRRIPVHGPPVKWKYIHIAGYIITVTTVQSLCDRLKANPSKHLNQFSKRLADRGGDDVGERAHEPQANNVC